MKILTKFLEEIKTNPKNSHITTVVNSLKNEDLKNIYFEVYHTAITKLSKLISCIIYASIKMLLEKWKGYYRVQDKSNMLKDLLEFLKENLDYVKETVNEKVAECAKVTTKHEKVNSRNTLDRVNMKAKKVCARIKPQNVNASTTSEQVNVNIILQGIDARTTPEKENPCTTSENVIMLMCPYNKLKSAFYSKLHPTENSFIQCNKAPQKDLKIYSYIYKMSELVNWPGIEIKLQLSNFVISRQNMNKTEFKLVSLSPNFTVNIQTESTELKYHKNEGYENDSFPSEFILAFFKQLKREILPLPYTNNLKKSVLSILSAFEKDVSLCTEEMDTNTEYFYNLNRYPYVRFLAQVPSHHSRPLIRHQEQISLDENSENVRLQQVFNPYVKFILSVFHVTYDLDNNLGYVFSIPRNYIYSLFNFSSITFKCCLCDFQCVGLRSNEALKNHLNSVHSVEPDWCCPFCEKGFTMQYLTANRWQHFCEKYKTACNLSDLNKNWK